MLELEDRIRTEVTRRADAYVPADDLPARIERRVRHRRVVRGSTIGVAAAAAVVVAVVTAGALTRPTEDGVIADHGTSSAPTTTAPPTTATTATTATEHPTTTTDRAEDGVGTTPVEGDGTVTVTSVPASVDPPEPAAPAGPAVADGMPLTAAGVGPITAGMTLREAEEASGNDITADEPIAPDSTCGTARIEGTAFVLMVERDPAADPLDAVIQVVTGGTATVEGVTLQSTEADVVARYGEPTRRVASLFPSTLHTLVYDQEGVGYQFPIGTDQRVTEVKSGFPVVYAEGCA